MGRVERNKGAIEALERIKVDLCTRELTSQGRAHVNKLINLYRNDTSSIENSTRRGKGGD